MARTRTSKVATRGASSHTAEATAAPKMTSTKAGASPSIIQATGDAPESRRTLQYHVARREAIGRSA